MPCFPCEHKASDGEDLLHTSIQIQGIPQDQGQGRAGRAKDENPHQGQRKLRLDQPRRCQVRPLPRLQGVLRSGRGPCSRDPDGGRVLQEDPRGSGLGGDHLAHQTVKPFNYHTVTSH